jgi:hypothetical protein
VSPKPEERQGQFPFTSFVHADAATANELCPKNRDFLRIARRARWRDRDRCNCAAAAALTLDYPVSYGFADRLAVHPQEQAGLRGGKPRRNVITGSGKSTGTGS